MRGGPFLHRIVLLPDETRPDTHPFDIPAFRAGIDLALRTGVTFFVGENGSGPSEHVAIDAGDTAVSAGSRFRPVCRFDPTLIPRVLWV